MNTLIKLTILSLLALNVTASFAQQSQKVVEQGIAIEYAADAQASGAKVRAGEDVNIKFKVTDTNTGTPVKGLNLFAAHQSGCSDRHT